MRNDINDIGFYSYKISNYAVPRDLCDCLREQDDLRGNFSSKHFSSSIICMKFKK